MRRKTRVVMVGGVALGGESPLRVQSMTTTVPSDLLGTLAETRRLVQAGCEIVRVTVPTEEEARRLEPLRRALEGEGLNIPLVADIHFKPEAALIAADYADKVRVNPGNFADGKAFRLKSYTDAEYARELDRVEQRFLPLLQKLKRLGRALRVGVNHGSLSDRIINRHGDTPEGLVESALEFLRLCERNGYRDVVVSLKASNPRLMIGANRLLVEKMAAEGFDHPLHLGVTEAGDGEDGRVKSAVGIGALLLDGIGDTIRVSLTEDPEKEIPVARILAELFHQPEGRPVPSVTNPRRGYARRITRRTLVGAVAAGGTEPIRVAVECEPRDMPPSTADMPVEILSVPREQTQVIESDSAQALTEEHSLLKDKNNTLLRFVARAPLEALCHVRFLVAQPEIQKSAAPLWLKVTNFKEPLLHGAAFLGALLTDGVGDIVQVETGRGPRADLAAAYGILQGAGARVTRAEFISCPSCGRTLFDIQSTLERIRARTGHLKNVKIAVMGCIVNGPGEMADADFGYVGGGVDKINLYVGKTCVQKGLPPEQAVDKLVDLIKKHNRWSEPQ